MKVKVTAWISRTSGNGFLCERDVKVCEIWQPEGLPARDSKTVEVDDETGEPDGCINGLWHFAIVGSSGRLGVFAETLELAIKHLRERGE